MGHIIKSLASFCLSVCLTVRAHAVVIFVRFDEILHRSWGPESTNAFVKGQNLMTLHYHPHNAFSTRRSEHCSKEARGPIMALIAQKGAAIDTKLQKCCNP